MKHCCKGFEHHFDEAGKKGISLILTSFSAIPTFVLQFRAVDQVDEGKANPGIKIITSTQAPVHYCPWCGKKLYKVIEKYKGMERDDLKL